MLKVEVFKLLIDVCYYFHPHHESGGGKAEEKKTEVKKKRTNKMACERKRKKRERDDGVINRSFRLHFWFYPHTETNIDTYLLYHVGMSIGARVGRREIESAATETRNRER